MPALYDKLGISFQYPENWTLDEQNAADGQASVAVFSPGGAFWSLVVHDRDARPDELVQAAVSTMRQEYPDLDLEAAQEEIAGHQAVGYDLNFYYLDLISTAAVRALQTGDATYLVFCQAVDHEFEQMAAVFCAITTSLLQRARTGRT